MVWIVAIIIGVICLLGGAFRLNENKKNGGETRLYAVLTYVGLVLVVVCRLQLISPYLTFLPDQYRTIIVLAIDIGVLMGGGEMILMPEMDRKKKDNHLAEYRDRQNSYKPKKKKKK